MKNDSIVRKQMMLYMATIAIFVAVVCGALTILYTKHYMAEKREELIQQGEKSHRPTRRDTGQAI